jgi:hypothetical protein
VLRAEPELFGPVASDPVISRLVTALAGDAPRALKAIRRARAGARQRAWALAGNAAPGSDGGQILVDIDATIVTSCSEKEQAAPTWKKTFGFDPLTVFADYGPDGPGEPLAIMLRPGNAGSVRHEVAQVEWIHREEAADAEGVIPGQCPRACPRSDVRRW